MDIQTGPNLRPAIGAVPYRMALAGGWIDQPFMSQINPDPFGSMVVVCLEADRYLMERCGMATGTRNVALQRWNGRLPAGGDPAHLVRELYIAENQGRPEPSGSQDMIGLIYPGINRLDYTCAFEGGYFPAQIVTCRDREVAHWLEQVIYLVPVNQRPPGYNPLGIKHLEPGWVQRLGRTGKDCYAAVLAKDLKALGASLNECMRCWEWLLPHTVAHPTISIDLVGLLKTYQERYPGAMYSGCGGGYIYIVSEEVVPGAFQVHIRL